MIREKALIGLWFLGSVTTLVQTDLGSKFYFPDAKTEDTKPEAKPKQKNNCKGDADTPTGAREVAFCLAKKLYGWHGDELVALNNLWTWESRFDYRADNPFSSAIGIPQCLASEHPECYQDWWLENPRRQVRWGLKYIKQRSDYGTPSAAWWWHQQRNPHWY